MWRSWGLALTLLLGAQASTLEQVSKSLEAPPAEARIMMRWWWFGPAVTREELARELEAMRAAGIGGVEIQPVYPLTLDDPERGIRNLRFLSKEFLEALEFASRKGRELGLRVDLTLGSGWPFGGPGIPRELAARRLRVEPLGRPEQLRWGERVVGEYPEAGLRFVETQTGQMVKRAAVGAEGFVFDHYSRQALDRYLETVGHPLLRGLGSSRHSRSSAIASRLSRRTGPRTCLRSSGAAAATICCRIFRRWRESGTRRKPASAMTGP